MISINSWGPMRYCLDKNMTQYIFGCNHSNEYPFTGSGSEWMFSSHASCGFNTKCGGSNYQNAMYKRDNNPYEPIFSARKHQGEKLTTNSLKIPDFGVLNMNTIGQEREYHQFYGDIAQLAVYNKDKTEEEILIIEDILIGESNHDVNKTGEINLFDYENETH